jgi:polyhydroxyalkanoate synthesis regulator phasin
MAERRKTGQGGRSRRPSGRGGQGQRSSGGGRSRASSARSSSARSSRGRSASSRSGASRSGTSRAKSGRSTSSARKAAARKGGKARGRQQRARSQAKRTSRAAARPAEGLDVSAKTVAEFREALRRNLIRPFDLVMLTRDRIEEVLAEAVSRGRVTTDDAQDLAAGLLQRGRKQTNDVLRDLEQLLGRSRDEIEGRTSGARRAGTDAARRARDRAVKTADPALAQADRVRRAAGMGPTFPVLGYDDLTASQVQARLSGLTPAELRKVRDYERRHGNRKSVLNAIEGRLS